MPQSLIKRCDKRGDSDRTNAAVFCLSVHLAILQTGVELVNQSAVLLISLSRKQSEERKTCHYCHQAHKAVACIVYKLFERFCNNSGYMKHSSVVSFIKNQSLKLFHLFILYDANIF
jgi:hypothetical protein